MEMHAMASLAGDNFRMPQTAVAASAPSETVKTVSAKSSKK
jgi:hypothetical protein